MFLFIHFKYFSARGQIMNCPCVATLWDKKKKKGFQSEINDYNFSFHDIFLFLVIQ